VFLAVDGNLPSRDALSGYLDSETATEPRTALLSGGPRIVRAATGPTVCACFSIGRDTIRRSIAQNRLGNVAELGAALKAGTNCGTCIPELRQILEECGAIAI
jgi:assimilatory nitrate reductase catalytic subunit